MLKVGDFVRCGNLEGFVERLIDKNVLRKCTNPNFRNNEENIEVFDFLARLPSEKGPDATLQFVDKGNIKVIEKDGGYSHM